mmetsp:Transcript_92481/g.160643  ORF Transcript_92481/g.160643 Transcript_92481/m.160643 type:complete len:399 (+) Transcript_92481:58-1254(+)
MAANHERGGFGPSRGGNARGAEVLTAAKPALKIKDDKERDKNQVAQYNWAHSHMQYLPNEARREAEEAIAAARDKELHWQQAAKEAEQRRDEALSQKQEAEVEAMRKVHECHWAAVKQATEYEVRIQALETVLEDERKKHEEELRRHEDEARKAREHCEQMIKESQAQHAAQVAAANARAQDAEDRSLQAMKRAEMEIDASRKREEARVKDIRRWADARVREVEDQKAFEVQKMHDKTVMRQRQMEETLYLNGRQKSEAMEDAKRHVRAMDTHMKEWKAIEEVELARKEARLTEWTGVQRRQNTSFENHHKGMLDLEKSLHNKTMERIMNRVNRQLVYGDGATGGTETPSRQVLQDLQASASLSSTTTAAIRDGVGAQGLSPKAIGSPLAAAGALTAR